ncbi:aldo/keto reductase, partial [Rhizobium ruizarguesonis]
LKVSKVSLGTMAFGRWIGEQEAGQVLDAALDAGINLIDTADVYGRGMDQNNPLLTGESEEILGRLFSTARMMWNLLSPASLTPLPTRPFTFV